MSIKINSLELENVKRIKAVKLEPTENGLTIIGGRNNQGKSSVLDAIAWVLGGNFKKPSNPQREGSTNYPYLKVTLNNGLIVERKGKNSSLVITDPSGNKQSSQSLLDSFIEELAIDLPKFMNSTSKEKADTLLQIIGVGDQLALLDKEIQSKYNERKVIGQEARRKKSHAEELPSFDGVPTEFIKASDLIQQQQAILARNGENQRKRDQVKELESKFRQQEELIRTREAEIKKMVIELDQFKKKHEETANDLEIAKTDVSILQDESTKELEQNIAEIETINDKIRTNQQKELAEEEANKLEKQYQSMNDEIDQLRMQRLSLLNGADLPLTELSVNEDGELTYKSQQWDGMSGSEQLRVATAIVRKLKPQCGFILVDKLEQMDLQTLNEFGDWLTKEGLQAIATRVSTGEECQIIISDGYVENEEESPTDVPKESVNTWKGGF
ncbi:AAA family ATPase [Aerococcus christensenii]|uniref:AAA family ATPase n=1 Tax=Aerococcus christensenii TaxID=87541 RepID=UPI003F421B7D